MKVLVVDLGGANVKILATGETEPRKFASGPSLTAAKMARGVRKVAAGWKYDVVTIGYPGAVVRDRPIAEPHNLAPGWVGFDYRRAFARPVRIINDAGFRLWEQAPAREAAATSLADAPQRRRPRRPPNAARRAAARSRLRQEGRRNAR